MKAIKRFKEKLAVLIQISAGQPARAPELLSIRHYNTRSGGRRNIFIEDGKVVLVAAYHKGYNLGGNTKIIHRYLPQEVGELVVRYLWLVEPFQRQLEVAIEGKSYGRGYLWERGMDDKKWTSERIGRLMEQESQIGMGVKVGISVYRQMAIAIARHCLKGEGMVDDRDDEEDIEDDNDNAHSQDHILDLQAGHGSHVAGMIYARAILEAPGEVASIRQQYRHASEAWHRLLQFPSTLGVLVKKRVWEADDQDGQFGKWKRMRTMNIYNPLERIVGVGGQFRGIQERVIKAIMRGESPIVSVMGTGAGKSLLFMLPAMCSAMNSGQGRPGMTIVVIPMISLRQDIQRRCQAVGLSCAEWDYRHPQAGVSIMLVTSESAVSQGFQAFILRIRARHDLERIVIDECHTVLDSREDFRPKLQRLSELWAAECQIVMLTATLPPEDEGRFCRIMRIPRDIIQWFRAPTSRPNIVYRVHRQDGRDDEAVREVIQVVLGQFPQGKVVIYSTSVARVKALAEKLDCEAYYRSIDEKNQVFKRIIQPECPMVVATNALGLGIDMPNIRAVIHVDGPRSIRDFGQESGRGGRDGQMSYSIIMVPPEFEHSDVGVNQFIQGQRCCRVILDGYLDGREDRQQCEAHEEACYVCQPSTPEPEEPASEEEMQARQEFKFQARQREQLQAWVQQMRSKEAIAVDELVQYLDGWANRCPWCYAQGRTQDSSEHTFQECTAVDVDQVRLECEMMRKGIGYQKYCVCYDCGVPQAICDRFESNSQGGWKWRRTGECQYKGVMIGGIIGMMRANINRCSDAIGAWMQSDGVNERDPQAVYKWMGQKIRWGGMEAAMINRVFYELAIATG
jgi:superfamily II DNA helicase RecQ